MRLIIALAVALFFVCGKQYDNTPNPPKPAAVHYGDRPANTENPDWRLIEYSLSGVVVMWQEKYGGEKRDTCFGLWESRDGKTYLLTWKDSRMVVILKENINDLHYQLLDAVAITEKQQL